MGDKKLCGFLRDFFFPQLIKNTANAIRAGKGLCPRWWQLRVSNEVKLQPEAIAFPS